MTSPRNPFDPTIRVLHGLRRGLERKRRSVGLGREEDDRLQVIVDGIDRLELAEERWDETGRGCPASVASRMITLLGFGSSARRGQRPWTDRARVRNVIDVLRPDCTVDGASPSGGLDDIFHEEAVAAGIPGIERCPYEADVDGKGGRGFLARNARMYRSHQGRFSGDIFVAAGWIVGKVGSPMSSGSAHMAGICQRGLREERIPPCPLVIFRDDGIEPAPDPLAAMRLLYARTRAPELVPAGQALRTLTEDKASREEVLAALACAREGCRFGPWVEAVERAIRGLAVAA